MRDISSRDPRDFLNLHFGTEFPRNYFLVRNVVNDLSVFLTHYSSGLCMYLISHEWYFKLNYQCELN